MGSEEEPENAVQAENREADFVNLRDGRSRFQLNFL
jgi:hypothetical protein